MVCVTLVSLSCDCYLYAIETAAAASTGPQDEKALFRRLKRREGEE